MAKKPAGTPTIRLDIDAVLKKRGRTAYWLANELGIGHGNLYRYRKGQINAVNLNLLARMCAALQCTPGDLLALEDDTKITKPKAPKAKG
ncbi:MAG TPA: helix-turn-helix transcriptional regulator [Blastocatellia bacterium]